MRSLCALRASGGLSQGGTGSALHSTEILLEQGQRMDEDPLGSYYSNPQEKRPEPDAKGREEGKCGRC